MAEQYSVEAVLSVADRGFTQAMQKADAMTDKLTNSSKNSAGGIGRMAASFGIGQIAANVATSAFNAMTNAIGSITGEMNDNQKAWKTFDGNMRMIGKSEQEIVKVQASLQDFATQTIYSASDMASTYSQMASIGVADTERLVKGMGGLAASAENPAQAMKSMSQQMVQAMAQPEMKWQDFRIMMDQAPAAMAQVAQEMGYDLDELIVAIQDGEVASKDFAAAVADVGTNEHFSTMATEYKTIDQAVDGLTETLANKFMPAFELVNEMGINAVEAFTDWIDAMDITKATNNLRKLGIRLGLIEGEFADLTEVVSLTTEEITTIADDWEEMTLEEKQASVETMGQEDLAELMELLGVDFDSIPDDYTKEAYLNAYGKDALEELRWVTGTWHNLTLEEKWAVLKQQIENDQIEDVIEQRGLWNETEFISQLAEINMNDTDALQQVTDLINEWGTLEGLEPIELEVEALTEQVVESLFTKMNWETLGESIGEMLGAAINGFAGLDLGETTSLQTIIENFVTGAFDGLDGFINGLLEGISSSVMWSKLLPKFEMGGETLNWETFLDNLPKNWSELLWGTGVNSMEPIEPEVGVEPKPVLGEEGAWDETIWPEYAKKIDNAFSDIPPLTPEMELYIRTQINTEHPELNSAQFEQAIQAVIQNYEATGEIDFEAVLNMQEIDLEDSTSFFDEISNIFKGKTVSAQVDIQPVASVGSSSQTASATGGGTAPSIDYSALIEATNTAMQSINQSTQSGMQRNVEAVRQGGSQMVMAMLTSGNSMVNTSQSISNQVVSVFNNMQSRMFSAGFNAGSGFNQGLASQRSNIISTAQSIADSVSDTINNALKIASPSKLLYQSGSWAIEGMVLGMESMLADVMSVSNDVALAAIPDIPDLPLPNVDYGSYGGVSRNLLEHTFTQQSNSNSGLEAKLDELLSAVRDGQIIVLDNGAVAGGTLPYIDRGLQNNIGLGGRHKL